MAQTREPKSRVLKMKMLVKSFTFYWEIATIMKQTHGDRVVRINEITSVKCSFRDKFHNFATWVHDFFNLLFFKACCMKSVISIVLIDLLSFVLLLIKVVRTENVV